MLQRINTFPYPKCALLIKNLTIFPRILDNQWYSLQFTNDKTTNDLTMNQKMQNTNTGHNQKKSESGIVTNPL